MTVKKESFIDFIDAKHLNVIQPRIIANEVYDDFNRWLFCSKNIKSKDVISDTASYVLMTRAALISMRDELVAHGMDTKRAEELCEAIQDRCFTPKIKRKTSDIDDAVEMYLKLYTISKEMDMYGRKDSLIAMFDDIAEAAVQHVKELFGKKAVNERHLNNISAHATDIYHAQMVGKLVVNKIIIELS